MNDEQRDTQGDSDKKKWHAPTSAPVSIAERTESNYGFGIDGGGPLYSSS